MRIGIGVGRESRRLISCLVSLPEDLVPVLYGRRESLPDAPSRCERAVHKEPEHALALDLAEGQIDAAVRGSLPANEALRALKSAMEVERLERVALLETGKGRKFLLAPVGVDEGWTVAERISLAKNARSLATVIGLPTEVGILSGGRLGDIGRHPAVDRTLGDAELIARLIGGRHCEILIEEAVESCGVVIAPDGIAGNLIFRTLVLLGGGRGHGAPVVNIHRIFVDTSRASPDYSNAILLADSLAKKHKKGINRTEL
ncbi:MAG: methanogenesis marker protein Mmp4/MtxX [Methanomicrobiales archaeon]|nr:methanogenesis marker protein Mmp4/MtxX [Methanomicrobiales archaeon]